ncbi:glutamate racemase [Pelotomaculum terephthalicicum JT]|uniref:glutamate racemase n=1 Tax=Pelotomaculum TaxID=191373 RepID=UPI0009C584D2|nr:MULTISPECIES: glutamate racemase [Pelotomaculum]MCG9968719.1 glutamate racemase [Pelotomaculum terephthalicicum JT]OPX92356.1 MAG: Glutamate racemase 1 [Pelotomaculum sp. PtaB.Bin117]OPY61973.1 MAG: Glutamate racemase 1 [Pelotomaculum sp. PtaU1.Bin065]
MNNGGAIGLFDSGIGGLTVFREVNRILPNESVVYYGDTAHVPYGSRSFEELIYFAGRIVAYLVEQKIKYVIFACNTSSALSLPVLKKIYSLPMMGLVQPGAAEALRLTRNRKAGVIATEVTIKTRAYEKALKALDGNVEVVSLAAPLLVPLVETGDPNTQPAAAVVRESLAPLRGAGIDTLILGCTHYPFLKGLIASEMGPEVRLVDPAGATVRSAAKEMAGLGLLAAGGAVPAHRFVVSGDPEAFREKARLFMGSDIGPVARVAL